MCLKKLGQGLIIGLVPAFVSLFIWDFSEVTYKISMPWFITILAIATTIGLSIALRMWFVEQVDRRFNATAEAFKTGVMWYFELLIIYFVTAIWILGNPMYKFIPAIFMLSIIVIISTTVGSIIDDRKQTLTTTSLQNENYEKPKPHHKKKK